jgi:hypothetical protein
MEVRLAQFFPSRHHWELVKLETQQAVNFASMAPEKNGSVRGK